MLKLPIKTNLDLGDICCVRLQVLHLFVLKDKTTCLISLGHQIVIHHKRVPGIDYGARLKGIKLVKTF